MNDVENERDCLQVQVKVKGLMEHELTEFLSRIFAKKVPLTNYFKTTFNYATLCAKFQAFLIGSTPSNARPFHRKLNTSEIH